jgi:hypothetical protein
MDPSGSIGIHGSAFSDLACGLVWALSLIVLDPEFNSASSVVTFKGSPRAKRRSFDQNIGLNDGFTQ